MHDLSPAKHSLRHFDTDKHCLQKSSSSSRVRTKMINFFLTAVCQTNADVVLRYNKEIVVQHQLAFRRQLTFSLAEHSKLRKVMAEWRDVSQELNKTRLVGANLPTR